MNLRAKGGSHPEFVLPGDEKEELVACVLSNLMFAGNCFKESKAPGNAESKRVEGERGVWDGFVGHTFKKN